MGSKISIKELATEITKELAQYSEDVAEEIKKEVENVAKETVQDIKENSLQKTGEYKKGWTYKVQFENRESIRIRVYNKKKPQLTHLLENGHLIKSKSGKVIGRVEPHPHIRLAEQRAEKQLTRKVEMVVSRGKS